MPRGKAKFVKKYESLLKKKDVKESEFVEADRKLSEDTKESEEGLEIEEEEEAGEEAYPEIDENLGHEDNPDKEDE